MSALPKAASALARAALRYAEAGWYVFPLTPRAKTPIIRGGRGFLEATCDVDQVRRWWAEWPDANIGLWPGRSGLVVVDIDGPEGETAARDLGAVSEPTLVATTGRAGGGRHLYFRHPGETVPNAVLAPKLDIRGDAGYVVIPPSIHPSGVPYRWHGKLAEVRDLPPGVRRALAAAGRSDASAEPTPGMRAAREIPLEESIDEGGRNAALTRYAGRLLAKGIPPEETLTLVSALNAQKCHPPLPQHEINALVASIATREARKRTTASGATLALVAPQAEPEPAAPFSALAAEQVTAARELLTRDITTAPRWAWPDVDRLAGAMMPGDFLVVGSLMGNGKSTMLMSQMDAFAEARMPVLYVPLEIDPEVCRLRWAAWRLGYDVRHAIRQDWRLLPEGAREALDCVLDEQEQNPYLHFVPDKRLTLPALVAWCRRAKDEMGCRVVMLDHFHRLDFGVDAVAHRVTVTEVARRLKDAARELELVIIAAAQLNRTSDPIDRYMAPQLSRLKESAGIGEECDVALMLSRRLRPDLPDHWANEIRVGHLTEADLAEPRTMVITCRKHRLDDSGLDHSVLLTVNNGRLESRAPSWRIP